MRADWRTTGERRACCAPPRAARRSAWAEDERFLGLIHLGPKRQEQPPPARARPGRVRNVSAVIRREDALKAFAEDEYDLVVIGGGITGAGVALDAATRGYSVALVEREDYASGTSSRSSKLVHGGLRYLQNFDLGLVREALLERSILVKLAPHLVRPLPLLVSSFEGKRPDRMLGHGAEHVRPDGARAEAPGQARPRPVHGRGGLEPREAPHHRGRRGARAPAGACAARADGGIPLLRLPDRRRAARAHRARRGRALRRGVRQPLPRGGADRPSRAARSACAART